MTRDPFRPAGCTCDETGKLRALLEGQPEPLCAVHEVEAIEARDAAAARAQADHDKAVIREAIRAASPAPPDPPPFTLNDAAGIKHALADALRAAVTEADPTTPLDAAQPRETS